MRAIVLMFDSLNRHMIPPYLDESIVAPNFKRLAEKTLTFSKFYAGSMPCMPARREMHTGRYNFLHRSWGPLEPFDDSMPEILSSNGVHTHLTSDHLHYWEDGGSTYHTRFTTWEFHRGKQGDPWKGVLDGKPVPRMNRRAQDAINRTYMAEEAFHSQTKTYDAGMHFLDVNNKADNWMLQIETFDPHEPFFTYQKYLDLYQFKSGGEDPELDDPPYGKIAENEAEIESAIRHYKALVTQCDASIGRVLDFMDEHDMWKDTMLLVNTDHGFLLGEHGYWAKGVMPWYEELIHLPFYLHDPRNPQPGQTTDVLAQTIDIAPTMLGFFGKEIPKDMQGGDLAKVLAKSTAPKSYALFGGHAGHVNITDGRYVYMRGCAVPENEPIEEYTLMPTRMVNRFSIKDLTNWEQGPTFGFTKGLQTIKTKTNGNKWFNPWRYGTLLFDVENDPQQQNPIVDDELELAMANQLVLLMRATEAPESQYLRLGLPAEGMVTAEHLQVKETRDRSFESLKPMIPISEVPLPLQAPFAQLVQDPKIRPILSKYVPDSMTTEFINAPRSFGLVSVVRMSIVSAETFKQIIDEYNQTEE